MPDWRIYYGDGSTFDDAKHPERAPARNVQVIARKYDNERGFSLMHGKDAFVYRVDPGYPGRWDAVDTAGLWDYFLNYEGWKLVIFGRNVPDECYKQVVSRAGREGLG